MNARAAFERAAGRSVVERIGFLLAMVCALVIVAVALRRAGTVAEIPEYIVRAFVGRYPFDYLHWPAKGLLLGLVLRFVASPLIRWLRSGGRR